MYTYTFSMICYPLCLLLRFENTVTWNYYAWLRKYQGTLTGVYKLEVRQGLIPRPRNRTDCRAVDRQKLKIQENCHEF
jgi:hypothetical protein